MTSRVEAGRPSRRPLVLLTLADRPFPADRGKRMRQAALLRGLTSVAEVDVALVLPGEAAVDGAVVPEHLGARRSLTIAAPIDRWPGALVRMATGRVPWQIAVRDYEVVRRQLAGWADSKYDLLLFGALDHEVALRGVVDAVRTVVDLDDVETEKHRAFLALPRQPGARSLVKRLQRRIEVPLWGRLQERACERNSAVLVCSELDRTRLDRPAVRVVPNTYPDPGEPDLSSARPPVLLMVGTWSYGPNADSARYAVRDILPLVRRRVPRAQLRLVGADSERLQDLHGLPGVEVVGYVDDLAAELRAASLALVPWRYGGGTRLKVVEALAWGVPLVATPLGWEGLGLVPGVHGLIARDAEGLAAATVTVLEDELLRQQLASRGREHYRRHFQPEAADAALVRVVAEVARPGAA